MDVKDSIKFNPASLQFGQSEEIKKDPTNIKQEHVQPKKEEIKEEVKEPLVAHIPPQTLQALDQKSAFKTELIIPKVTVEKPLIKEELDSSNDASLLSISSKEDSSSQPSTHSLGNYKENPMYMHSNINLKDSISFGKLKPCYHGKFLTKNYKIIVNFRNERSSTDQPPTAKSRNEP